MRKNKYGVFFITICLPWIISCKGIETEGKSEQIEKENLERLNLDYLVPSDLFIHHSMGFTITKLDKIVKNKSEAIRSIQKYADYSKFGHINWRLIEVKKWLSLVGETDSGIIMIIYNSKSPEMAHGFFGA